MINFLKNKYTIISEIVVLSLSILWYWQSREIEPLITLIGSISFLMVSVSNLKKEKVSGLIERPKEKTLYQDFLYNYKPEEVGISKIIEDFGQPNKKTIESVEAEYLESGRIVFNVYEYKFSNAIVLFSTDTEVENVIAITLLPLAVKDQPINCPYVPSENEEDFSVAEFKKSILDYMQSFENNMYATWSYSAITSRYVDYRPIKYFYYTYINYNYHEEADDLYLEKIESICVSSSSIIHPIIHFDKLLFG